METDTTGPATGLQQAPASHKFVACHLGGRLRLSFERKANRGAGHLVKHRIAVGDPSEE